MKIEASARLQAAQVSAGRRIKTTNSKFAWEHIYKGERFNVVKTSDEGTYTDGIGVYVNQKNAGSAVAVWKKVIKRLAPNAKVSPRNPKYFSGEWYDELSDCTWEAQIAEGENGASLRIINLTNPHSNDLRYEELDEDDEE